MALFVVLQRSVLGTSNRQRTPPLHKKPKIVEKASGQPAKLAACFFVCRIWMNPVDIARCRGPPSILIFAHPKKIRIDRRTSPMAEKETAKTPVIRIHGYEFKVTKEEARAFRRFQRRVRYLEINIKQERFDRERAALLPSKEDSLERLYELGVDFAVEQEPLEETVVTKIMVDKLHECLDRLTEDERNLIFALFFQGMTVREYAEKAKIHFMTVHSRKERILGKLLKMLQE